MEDIQMTYDEFELEFADAIAARAVSYLDDGDLEDWDEAASQAIEELAMENNIELI